MIQVCAFYQFKPLTADMVRQLKLELEQMAEVQNVRGLVLIGREGINFTISGTEAGVSAFKSWLTTRMDLESPKFKDSFTNKHPFHIFKVKIKKEIVTIGDTALIPSGECHHISPKEWHEKMLTGEAVVLDTRNDYEVEIGKFKNALDLDIKEFHEFPKKLEDSGISKEREVLIYCTGGIRCEKAILEMKRQGYEKVSQLDGGILNYLKEFPKEQFEGECFVFDYRVAVDQELNATTQYKLCAHCGQPATSTVDCSMCSVKGIVCHHCVDKGIKTCSKNCENHAQLGSNSHKPHIHELRKRHRI